MAEQWWQFEAESSAPFGRWLVQDDEYRMVEAFVKREETEAGQIPSVFFQLETPFQTKASYGPALLQELVSTCLQPENQDDLEAFGISLSFVQSYENKKGPRDWITFLDEFRQQGPKIAGHIVPFLQPKQIADPEQFADWLMDVAETQIPPSIKIMLLDRVSQPILERFADFFSQQVEDLVPDLNMDDAMMEMAAMAGANDPDDPGVLYRKALVALMQHSQAGKLDQAKQFAQEAQEIAHVNFWPHLEVAAFLGLANAMLANQAFGEIFPVYTQAREAAKRAEQEDDTLGKRLAIQAWMSEGAARIADDDYPMAMQAYQSGATIGVEIEDHILALESWRMAGYCAEREKKWIDAWSFYQKTLSSAQQLPPDQCKNTTLPYAGHALLRLVSKSGSTQKDRVRILETMEQLLGPDWQEQPLTSQSS
ncbi:MAG: hypothetical protein AAFQ83_09970 [Bacteroidota bacterium]